MKIGDFAIEVMREEKLKYIGYNEFGLLDEIYARALKAGATRPIRDGKSWRSGFSDNPIHRQTIVLNALSRDKRFKAQKILCISRTSRAEHWVREFRIIAG